MKLETLLKIVFYPTFMLGLIFFAAFTYAGCWNMLMPELFGWVTVTKTQAYSVAMFVSLGQYATTKTADNYPMVLMLSFIRLSWFWFASWIIVNFFI